MELQERRREQDAKMEQKRQEKEKAREEAARKRERKLEALNAAQQSSLVELTKKIQLRVSIVFSCIVCQSLKITVYAWLGVIAVANVRVYP